MQLLIGLCDAEDEGVRSMVAECLGRLALIAPVQVLPALKALLTKEAPEARATVVFSLKFTITDQAPMKELASCITDFLLLLKDPEIMVRRAALTTLNSATHNKPSLIRPVLSTDWLLPALYGETVYKPDLVRTVNLGPFQHKVDDGAELRKLSLACMDTLFDKCAEKLDTSTFLLHLQERLSDELDDMKQAAYHLLCKLAVREPAFVREVYTPTRTPCPMRSRLARRGDLTACSQIVCACSLIVCQPWILNSKQCAGPGAGAGFACGPHFDRSQEEDKGKCLSARR